MDSKLIAAVKNGDLEAVKEAIEGGEDKNGGDKFSMTAVHYAVLKDFVDIVTYLVEEQGADLEISTKDGATPFSTAAANGNERMLRLLMDYGANPFTLFFDRTARDRAKNKGHLFLLPAIDAYEKEFPFLQHLSWEDVPHARAVLEAEALREKLVAPLMLTLLDPSSSLLPPQDLLDSLVEEQGGEEGEQGEGGGAHARTVQFDEHVIEIFKNCPPQEFFGRGSCHPCPSNTRSSPNSVFECVPCGFFSFRTSEQPSDQCLSCLQFQDGALGQTTCLFPITVSLVLLVLSFLVASLLRKVNALQQHLTKGGKQA